MSSFVVVLDADAAGHLAVAVRRHRGELQRRGWQCPGGLEEVEALAASIASDGQERSRVVKVKRLDHPRLDDRDFFSPSEVCTVTGLSDSTIRRRLRDGTLRSTVVGRARRVSRPDLEAFLGIGERA
jgi:excisionase family DNA binding protein